MGDLKHRAMPHDTLLMGDRQWTVTGDFMGGLGQESVLGLQVAGDRQDAGAYGKTIPELFVPEIFVKTLSEAGALTIIRAAGA